MELILQQMALGGYAVATVLAFFSILLRRKVMFALAPLFAGLGFAAHLVAFAGGLWSPAGLAGFGIDQVISLLSLIAVGIYLYGYARYKMHVLGIVMLPLALVLYEISGWMPVEAVEVAARYSQPLLWSHIVVSTLGVGALFLTFSFSVMYLVQERALKEKKRPARFFLPLPSLTTCDHVLYVSLVIGFALLTVGLALAAIWSANARETFHVWQNQREILALVSWVIFGVVLYARLVSGWRGRKMALLAIAGFAAVMLRIIGGPFL